MDVQCFKFPVPVSTPCPKAVPAGALIRRAFMRLRRCPSTSLPARTSKNVESWSFLRRALEGACNDGGEWELGLAILSSDLAARSPGPKPCCSKKFCRRHGQLWGQPEPGELEHSHCILPALWPLEIVDVHVANYARCFSCSRPDFLVLSCYESPCV